MQRLASETQCFCKVSGLLTEATPRLSPEAALQELTPWLDHLFKVFPIERLMWGSDWPVLELACPDSIGSEPTIYHSWYTMMNSYLSTRQYGSEACDRFFGGTAAEFYQISG